MLCLQSRRLKIGAPCAKLNIILSNRFFSYFQVAPCNNIVAGNPTAAHQSLPAWLLRSTLETNILKMQHLDLVQVYKAVVYLLYRCFVQLEQKIAHPIV